MSRPETPTAKDAFRAGSAGAIPAVERAMIERRAALLGPAYRLFYEEPVHIVRGEGVWLFDPAGQAYLDVYNNVASIGHSQPDVVAAVSRQWTTLNTHTRYLHDTILRYAERLLATVPASLRHVMFTCTGSEANDLAYRMAKRATGGTGVIVTETAYHGVTDAVAAFSPSLGRQGLGTHVRAIPAPDAHRHAGVTDVGAAMAAHVRAAVDDLAASGVSPAALVVDTVFSSDGVFTDPPGFLAGAVAAIREAGGLFIADEVQAGFGRTGDALWGYGRHGVEPDIVTLGKPMGNGQPIGAVMARPDIVAAFAEGTRYFNTFGGNPVSCAAGLAVLDVIVRDGLMRHARDVGTFLRSGLDELAQRHQVIGEVRGAGLFIGVEIVREDDRRDPDGPGAQRLVNDLRRRHILISASGPHANVLKIRPPLVFTRDHAELFISVLNDLLSNVRGRS